MMICINENKIYYINIFIVILVMFSLSSCELFNKNDKKDLSLVGSDSVYNNEIKKNLTSKCKAVYLSYDPNPDNNEFSSIKVIDFQTKENISLVDSTYYNVFPIWMPDGENILFASARIGELEQLRIRTGHAWKQLYLFNLKKREIIKFTHNSSQFEANGIFNYVGLVSNAERNEIYFSNFDNKLYSISNSGDKLKLIKELKKEDAITNLSLSYNNRYLAIDCMNVNEIDKELFILDLEKNEIFYHFNELGYIAIIGWSLENMPYLRIHEKYFQLDLNNNLLKELNFNLDKKNYSIRNIFMESKNKAIILAGKSNIDSKTKIPSTAGEIARYNFETKELEWITNDEYEKSNLNIFVKN